jgi:hypothetical protein
MIITVSEARKILGKSSKNMSDDEIIDVISTLDIIAKDSLEKLRIKRDANELASLIYDVYQDEKKINKKN